MFIKLTQREIILLHCALHTHFDAVHFLARGDEEQSTVLASEGHVGCPRFRDRDVRQLLPSLVKYSHATSGEINVSFGVYSHAIRTHFAKQRLVFESTVGV